jgi:hypothetical protein
MLAWSRLPGAVLGMLMLGAACGWGQTLTVTPAVVSVGQKATLSWDTKGRVGYLTGVGRVTAAGSMVISPEGDTQYVLVTEGDLKYVFNVANVAVSGKKGEDDLPAASSFGDAVKGPDRAGDYLNFQKVVWDWLQNNGYVPHGDFEPGRPYLRFYTGYQLRPDLVVKGEKVRARRIALAVDLNSPTQKGAAISYGVHWRLQFQNPGESQWREDKTDVGRQEALKVAKTLGTIQ